MCGLVAGCGIFSKPDLELSLELIRHRGPDGSGWFRDSGVKMGHTRLAVVDPDSGWQPWVSPDGKRSLVFNGEIYNASLLRGQYKLDCSTNSDTEVLFKLYEKLGAECVPLLQGMFAFVYWDGEGFFAARDSLGIKPLYFRREGQDMYFASELKCFAPEWQQIEEFSPGTWYHYKTGFERYFSLENINKLPSVDYSEACKQIKQLLESAVHKRLVADVPVGAFLSGGLDSSLIAALMRKEIPELHSFAIGVKGSADHSAARIAAQALGTIHHEIEISEDELSDVVNKVVWHLESYDAPLIRSSLINFILAKHARQHVTVVLTGEGADEIFGGYSYLRDFTDPKDFEAERLRIIKGLYNTNLQRADRMSMAHGLEARVPFLDPTLIEYVLSLPSDMVMPTEGRQEKAILRDACRDLLPSEIIDRKKEKFSQGAGTMFLVEKLAAQSISDKELAEAQNDFPEADLRSKEELLYFKEFRRQFPDFRQYNKVGRTANLRA